MAKYTAILFWVLVGLFAGTADRYLKNGMAAAGVGVGVAPHGAGFGSDPASTPTAQAVEAYGRTMPDSALNTMERGLDETGDGVLDTWVVSVNRDYSLPESAQVPLSLYTILQDKNSDGRPDELVIAVGPEGRRTEMVFDVAEGRRDLITTVGEGRKFGYTDIDGDGFFDLITEYREDREPKVERWVITATATYRVLRVVDRDAYEFVVAIAPGEERTAKWNGSQWGYVD